MNLSTIFLFSLTLALLLCANLLCVQSNDVSGYNEICSDDLLCDKFKNLTCSNNNKSRHCTCLKNASPNVTYLHDSDTKSCIPIPIDEKPQFRVCERKIQGASAITMKKLDPTFLRFCKSNYECNMNIQDTYCDFKSCSCEPNSLRLGAQENCTNVIIYGIRQANGSKSFNCIEVDKNLMDPCIITEQCATSYSSCTNGQCKCNETWEGKPVIYNIRDLNCTLTKGINESCSTNIECNSGALCTKDYFNRSTCQCKNDFIDNGGTCLQQLPSKNNTLQIQFSTVGFYIFGIAGGIISVLFIVILVRALASCHNRHQQRKQPSPRRKEAGRRPGESNVTQPILLNVPRIATQVAQNAAYLYNTSISSKSSKIWGKCNEISREEFQIDNSKFLGKGKGGIVFVGTYNYMTVAIKTLNPLCQRVDMYMQSIYQEIEIYRSLSSDHPNIVKLIAFCREVASSCTNSIQPRLTVYMIMEYCQFGNLKNYLIQNKFLKTDDVQSHGTNETDYYTKNDLMIWSYQIACAMEFLWLENIVHADLALRNVLVYRKDLVKIADFGLGRKLEEESATYVKTRPEPGLPWKWSAPEVFTEAVYSTYSDVWSFGVTLWEIFSLGNEPYKGIDISQRETFLAGLSNGTIRPERPKLAPIEIYNLMKKCWHTSPKLRISFENLRIQLNQIIQQPNLQDPDGYLIPTAVNANLLKNYNPGNKRS